MRAFDLLIRRFWVRTPHPIEGFFIPFKAEQHEGPTKIGPAAVTIEQTAIDQIGDVGSGDGYLLSVPMVDPRASDIDGGPFSVARQHFHRQSQNFVSGIEALIWRFVRRLGP